MIKRTISGRNGKGSLAHNRRAFETENVDKTRVHLNIKYCDENLKAVYHELFDSAVERYNVGKRNDRKITDYYEKIRQSKQEKLFHEVIFQIGNCTDTAVGTEEGELAVKILDEYMKEFQKRNPSLRVFSCHLHLDESTPHLHVDFVPYVTGWKGSRSQILHPAQAPAISTEDTSGPVSALSQWPVQLKLLPVEAPFYDGASLLVAADCSAFSRADFHARFMAGRITAIGCPKLDEGDYTEKLTEILRRNAIRDVLVVRMEVPCCGGIERAVRTAVAQCGKDLPLQVITLGRDGHILEA